MIPQVSFTDNETKGAFKLGTDDPLRCHYYLEGQSRPNLVCKDFSNDFVKGSQDLHRKLRLDTSFVDQVIKRVGQRQPEAGGSLS